MGKKSVLLRDLYSMNEVITGMHLYNPNNAYTVYYFYFFIFFHHNSISPLSVAFKE